LHRQAKGRRKSVGQGSECRAAREAGCDQVMSKGEFARRLPELLEGI